MKFYRQFFCVRVLQNTCALLATADLALRALSENLVDRFSIHNFIAKISRKRSNSTLILRKTRVKIPRALGLQILVKKWVTHMVQTKTEVFFRSQSKNLALNKYEQQPGGLSTDERDHRSFFGVTKSKIVIRKNPPCSVIRCGAIHTFQSVDPKLRVS